MILIELGWYEVDEDHYKALIEGRDFEICLLDEGAVYKVYMGRRGDWFSYPPVAYTDAKVHNGPHLVFGDITLRGIKKRNEYLRQRD